MRVRAPYPRINAAKGTRWVPNRYRTVLLRAGLDEIAIACYNRSMKARSPVPAFALLVK